MRVWDYDKWWRRHDRHVRNRTDMCAKSYWYATTWQEIVIGKFTAKYRIGINTAPYSETIHICLHRRRWVATMPQSSRLTTVHTVYALWGIGCLRHGLWYCFSLTFRVNFCRQNVRVWDLRKIVRYSYTRQQAYKRSPRPTSWIRLQYLRYAVQNKRDAGETWAKSHGCTAVRVCSVRKTIHTTQRRTFASNCTLKRSTIHVPAVWQAVQARHQPAPARGRTRQLPPVQMRRVRGRVPEVDTPRAPSANSPVIR